MKSFIEYTGDFDADQWIKSKAEPVNTKENTVSGETEDGNEEPGSAKDEED
jgi:uncharacterized protein YdaL